MKYKVGDNIVIRINDFSLHEEQREYFAVVVKANENGVLDENIRYKKWRKLKNKTYTPKRYRVRINSTDLNDKVLVNIYENQIIKKIQQQDEGEIK